MYRGRQEISKPFANPLELWRYGSITLDEVSTRYALTEHKLCNRKQQ